MTTKRFHTLKSRQLVGDVDGKIRLFKVSVWVTSHHDLGEIRTETAARPSPPEKKERLDTEAKKRLGKIQGAAFIYILIYISRNTAFKPEIFK